MINRRSKLLLNNKLFFFFFESIDSKKIDSQAFYLVLLFSFYLLLKIKKTVTYCVRDNHSMLDLFNQTFVQLQFDQYLFFSCFFFSDSIFFCPPPSFSLQTQLPFDRISRGNFLFSSSLQIKMHMFSLDYHSSNGRSAASQFVQILIITTIIISIRERIYRSFLFAILMKVLICVCVCICASARV